MKRTLITLLLLLCMAFALLTGCGKDGPITPEQATKIVLEELNVSADDVTIHTHSGTHEDQPCHIIYVTMDGHTMEYLVHGITGEILAVNESNHSH